MTTLNKPISPYLSTSIVESQSSPQFRKRRRRRIVAASGHPSSDSSSRNTQLGAEHQGDSGVLAFDDNAASKLAGLHPEREVCNFSNSIAHVNPEKMFFVEPDDAVFRPFTSGFTSSLESEHMQVLKMAGLEDGSDFATDTLAVSVRSGVKLQGGQMDQIAKKMRRLTEATHVSLKSTIDPSLIAGFVISYEKEGSHVIDLSVKSQLDELVARIESKDQSARFRASGPSMMQPKPQPLKSINRCV